MFLKISFSTAMADLLTLQELRWKERIDQDANQPRAKQFAFTGGAVGADMKFLSRLFTKRNFVVWSFDSHHVGKMPDGITIKYVQKADRQNALPEMRRAASALGKLLPHNPYTVNLMTRNYCIARDSDVIIAVAPRSRTQKKFSVGVEGGTGWTCQFFLQKYLFSAFFKSSREKLKIPIFLFDCGKWYACFYQNEHVAWEETTRPDISGFDRCGFIGTRELTALDHTEINELTK